MKPLWPTLLILLALASNPDAQGEPGAFVLGADISALDAPGPGDRPLPPYQENGRVQDELTILRRHGWSAFRVRVFVDPVREAPANNLEAAIPLARQITQSGAKLLLCLHFSDTWADPQHQEIPLAWRGLDAAGLAKKWEEHAYLVVSRLRIAGAMPDWVQIGNEITRGAAWPVGQLKMPGSDEYLPVEPYDDAEQWRRLTALLKAGTRGVRRASAATPVRIAIHIDRGGDWPTTRWFFDHVAQAGVDYDIIALSYYPPWKHGTLAQLNENLANCVARYGKDVLVVETGYEPSHKPDNPDMFWPVTAQGRAHFLGDLIATAKAAPRCIGVMYWAPEHDLWNADGSPNDGVRVLERAR